MACQGTVYAHGICCDGIIRQWLGGTGWIWHWLSLSHESTLWGLSRTTGFKRVENPTCSMVRLACMPRQVCAVRNCSKHPPNLINLHLMNRAVTVYWCQKSTPEINTSRKGIMMDHDRSWAFMGYLDVFGPFLRRAHPFFVSPRDSGSSAPGPAMAVRGIPGESQPLVYPLVI